MLQFKNMLFDLWMIVTTFGLLLSLLPNEAIK